LRAGRDRATSGTRYRTYENYRCTGNSWLSQLPDHWSLQRIKYAASVNDDVLTETTPVDRPMKYVDVGSVSPAKGITDFEELVFGDAPTRARRIVADGDVIVSTVRTYLRAIAPVVNPDPEVVVSTGFAVVRPRSGLLPRYAAFALQAPYFVEAVVANSVGVSFPAINPSEMACLPIAIPPLVDQRAIADFLDRETGKIDALVAKKERLIELLQEKRTALITHAVTKGLDPDVAMKPSGVDWLGDIPAHWKSVKTKFVARLESGHTPSRQHPEYWENCTVPWFGLADVWQIRDGKREYVTETAEKVSLLGLANSSARMLPKGTVILSRTASVGFSAIMGLDMATTQDFANWVPSGRVRSEFLLYVLRGMKQEFRRLVMGSTHQTIYMPAIGAFSTPWPPLEEQDAILPHIRKETGRIDNLVGAVEAAINRLKELRMALISAAVTGKIDVRNEAQ
jgi:type I restriction enzyme, S subunit